MSIYSIDQVAIICKVARNTVCKWFDSGELKGYRDSTFWEVRYVPRDRLIGFLEKHNIPYISWDGEIHTDENFTTGEAAAISRLNISTIIRLFDSGCLKGFRIPGSMFRRIPLFFFISFLEKYGLPSDGVYNLMSPRKEPAL